jgi:hypothetical protein
MLDRMMLRKPQVFTWNKKGAIKLILDRRVDANYIKKLPNPKNMEYKVKLATTNNKYSKENVLLVQAYVDQDLLSISSLPQQMNQVQGLNPAYHYTEMK